VTKDDASRTTDKANVACDSPITEDDKCTLGFLTVEEAAGIGAGVIAAIAIGAGVGAAIFIIGGKKGYDAWKNHQNKMDGANSNPMYKDDHLKGSNPFYNEQSAVEMRGK